MKLSDFFTSVRIVLAPVFFILYFIPSWTGCGAYLSVILLVPLFAFMEFTDFLDGYFARKHQCVSDFGKLFDPFADVLANLTIMFAFVLSGYLPTVLFLVILYREMSIMFVRMLASRKGVAIGARKGGKTKTVFYIISCGMSLAIESVARLGFSLGSFGPIAKYVNVGLYSVAVILSVVSFIDYLKTFSAVLKTQDE
jgi:CDP-diacylglycerol---glycerol-3-phosphate 3-phosphatidyltransferase